MLRSSRPRKLDFQSDAQAASLKADEDNSAWSQMKKHDCIFKFVCSSCKRSTWSVDTNVADIHHKQLTAAISTF